MTEQQWLACTDPQPMLEFLRDSEFAVERKLRLAAAACCRRAWPRLDADARAGLRKGARYRFTHTATLQLFAERTT